MEVHLTPQVINSAHATSEVDVYHNRTSFPDTHPCAARDISGVRRVVRHLHTNQSNSADQQAQYSKRQTPYTIDLNFAPAHPESQSLGLASHGSFNLFATQATAGPLPNIHSLSPNITIQSPVRQVQSAESKTENDPEAATFSGPIQPEEKRKHFHTFLKNCQFYEDRPIIEETSPRTDAAVVHEGGDVMNRPAEEQETVLRIDTGQTVNTMRENSFTATPFCHGGSRKAAKVPEATSAFLESSYPASCLLTPQNESPTMSWSDESNRCVSKATAAESRTPLQRDPRRAKPAPKPSEEDLLLLIMRRLRTREESEAKLIDEDSHLRRENRRLLEKNMQLLARSEEATEKWHVCLEEQHVQGAQLKLLRERFSKLKQGARDMLAEYHTLKALGDKLSRDIGSVKSASNFDLHSRIQIVSTHAAAVSKIEEIKSTVSEIRSTLSANDRVNAHLAEQRRNFQEERLCHRSYALHVEKLEKTQQSMHDDFSEKHQQIVEQMSKLSPALTAEHNEKAIQSIPRLLGPAEELSSQQERVEASSCQLNGRLIPVNENCKRLSADLSRVMSVQADQHRALNEQKLDLVASFENDFARTAELQEWKAKASGLAQQIQSREIQLRASQSDKILAQLLSLGLLELNKKIINDNEQKTNKDSDTRPNHPENAQLHLLLNSSRTDVSNLTTQLSAASKKLKALEEESANSMEDHKAKLEQLRSQCEAEKSELKEKLQEELRCKSSEVALYQVKCQELEQEKQDINSRLKANSIERWRFEKELESNKSQAYSKCQSIVDLQERKEQLEETVQYQEGLKKVPALQTESENYTSMAATTSNLRVENATLKQHLAQAIERLAETEQSIAQSKNELKSTKSTACEGNSLSEPIKQQAAQIGELIERNENLKSDAQCVIDLKLKIRAQEACISELHHALEQSESTAVKAPGFTAQLSTLRNERFDNEQYCCQVLEEKEEITDLRKQNASFKEKENKWVKLEEKCQQKDVELASMRDQISQLKHELQSYQPLKKVLTDTEIAALTEPNILTLKSSTRQSHPSQQHSHCEIDSSDADEGQKFKSRNAANSEGGEVGDGDFVPATQSPRLMQKALQTVTYFHLSPFDETDGCSENAYLSAVGAVHSRFSKASIARSRPGTSNDEMLLRSSDAAISSTHQARGFDTAVILVPASSRTTSPIKTCKGPRIRHDTPQPRRVQGKKRAVSFPTPPSVPTEQHVPNSAKRRHPSEAKEGITKRQKVEMSKVERGHSQKSNHCGRSDTMQGRARMLPKNGSTTRSSAPATGKRKRTNAPKQTARKVKYGERFNEGAECQ